MSTFPARFNAALEAKGISRRELARLSGVHVNTLNNWAGGGVPNPHPKQLQRVSVVLGVAYEWLRLGNDLGVSDQVEPGGPYSKSGEAAFDPQLMQQVVRLVEDHSRLFRRRLDEASRVALMERAYQHCVEAGFSGRQEISMTRFLEVVQDL